MIIIREYLVTVEHCNNVMEKIYSVYKVTITKNPISDVQREKLLAIPTDVLVLESCLDIAINEYSFERGKRSSFEARAGILLTLLCTIILFILDKIPYSDLYDSMISNDSICELLLTYVQLLSFLLFLFYWFFSANSAKRIIETKKIENTNLDKLGSSFITSYKIEGLPILIKSYKDLIKKHRECNEVCAENLKKSIDFFVKSLVLLIVYLLLT